MEKILVIDDSKITQLLVAEILHEHYVLEFRDDGPAGIEGAMTILPDLILLDVHLPKMEGYEVCSILKKEERTKDIPILFITSMDSAKERIKGFAAGAEDYVVKPFYLEELLARVKVHLASRRAKSQAVELERLSVFREMAVALSHEINNPLTTIFASLHLLQKELDDSSATVTQHLSTMHEELGRIRQITEKLSQASRVVTTPYTGDTTMIDLHNL